MMTGARPSFNRRSWKNILKMRTMCSCDTHLISLKYIHLLIGTSLTPGDTPEDVLFWVMLKVWAQEVSKNWQPYMVLMSQVATSISYNRKKLVNYIVDLHGIILSNLKFFLSFKLMIMFLVLMDLLAYTLVNILLIVYFLLQSLTK